MDDTTSSQPIVASRPELGPALNRLSVRQLWQARGVWLGVLALLVALSGTVQLASETTRQTGWMLIIVGGVLAVIAWGGQPWISAFAPRAAGNLKLKLV